MYTRILASVLTCLALATSASTARAQLNPRFGGTLRGDLVIVGNTLAQDCSVGVPAPVVGTVGACGTNTSDRGVDVYWRSDAPVGGMVEASTAVAGSDARSSATLTLPPGATVTQAYLYWAATISTGLPADTMATLSRPGAFSFDVMAIDCATTLSSYQCVADVTETVTSFGPGIFRVSGVESRNFQNLNQSGTFAGWSLAVVYALPTEPMRQIAVADGMQNVTIGTESVVTVSGFVVPAAGAAGQLWTVAYGGDASSTGDTLELDTSTVSNGSNPADNFFNSTNSRQGAPSSTAGDLPQLAGTPGSFGQFDIDSTDIASLLVSGATSVEVAARTTNDAFDLGMVGLSVRTLAPELVGVMTLTDLDGGVAEPGDTIRVSVNLTNTGDDAAVATFLEVPLVPEVDFVPGTLQVTSGANLGAKTDFEADDQAAWRDDSRRVEFFLGGTADGANGGVLDVGQSTSVAFDVVVVGGVGGRVALQGLAIAAGQSGAGRFSAPTDNDGLAPLAEPAFLDVLDCMGDDECSAPAPLCDTDTNACVGCFDDFDCGGDTPVCDALTQLCRGCGDGTECDAASPVCTESGACAACTPDDTSFCPIDLPACDGSPAECVECTDDTHCSADDGTPYCDIFMNVCVSCRGDGDCSGTEPVCGMGGVCRGCDSPGDCHGGDTSVCDPTGACVECNAFDSWSCGEDSPLCNVDQKVCVECLGPEDCGGTTPICLLFGRCAPCSSDDECGDGICLASGACTDCVDGHQPSCEATCGDGVRVDVVEACDDGNDTDFDGCSATCQIENGYDCIDLTGWLSACSSSCGDGEVAVGAETCDDQNTASGDGCDACDVESGYVCTGEPSACSPVALCGDGVVDSGEACDDGGTDGGDGCDGLCAAEDGFVCADQPSNCREDADGDDVADADDVCPEVSDDQADGDSDGFGDACDACPEEAAPGSVDGCVVSAGDDEPGFDSGGEDVGQVDASDDADDDVGQVDAGDDTDDDVEQVDAGDDTDAAQTDANSDDAVGIDADEDADADAPDADGNLGGGGGGGGGCAAAPRTASGAGVVVLVGLALIVARRRRGERDAVG